MSDCRTEDSRFNISPEYEQDDLPDLTDEYIKERLSDFYQFAKPKDTWIELNCALDALYTNKEGFELFWNQLSLALIKGKFPSLKKELDLYVINAIENNEDDWS